MAGDAHPPQRLVTVGDRFRKSIPVPTFVGEVAGVQVYCAFAEVAPGEATFPRSTPADRGPKRRSRGSHGAVALDGKRMTMTLRGRSALITGASRGLGLAIATALAARGAAVACMARAGEELTNGVAALRRSGARALAVPADVTRANEVEAGVRTTIAELGGLDIVVLNAGTWQGAPVHETSEEMWDRLLDLNLKGAFLALKSSLPHLLAQHRGTIVGITSIGGWVGQPGSAAYAASKWGLRGLLESVALEVKPAGVRVSIIAPHNINSAGRKIDPATEERRHALETTDIAELVAHICSAPDHVSVGNVTIWPIGAGIRAEG